MPFPRIVLAAPLLALAACGAARADRVSTATTTVPVAPTATQPPLLVVPRDSTAPIPVVAAVPAERVDVERIAAEQAAAEDALYPPAGLTDCQQMEWQRVNVGLPAHFWYLGNRESGKGVCDNTAVSNTGCCVGWWQLHRINWSDKRMIPRFAACGATWQNVRGDTREAKARQACATKALFDVAGYSPWKL